MTIRTDTFAGLFILVVEDEVILAMALEETLQDFGCSVALTGSVEDALSLIRETTPDGVLLDMNVHGRKTLAIAQELAGRSVPFLLVTGYGPTEADPPVIKEAPRLQKPFTGDVLGRRMAEVFVSPRSRQSLVSHGS